MDRFASIGSNRHGEERHIMVMGIFCGSSAGSDTVFIYATRMTGKTLAQAGIAIVYGGGRVGLMGAVACGAGAGR